MIEILLRDLRQPEYLHVLINPLPVYGLGVGVIALVVALFLRNRAAHITALVIILISSGAAYPVAYLGHQGYDRVLSMTDDAGRAWLDEHEDRGDDLVWFFYALAVLAAAAIFLPGKWPRAAVPLTVVTLLLSILCLGFGGYIAYAGGKLRHREFRNVPPPAEKTPEAQ
jgi:dolichol kinase